jgi:hypothetical protein
MRGGPTRAGSPGAERIRFPRRPVGEVIELMYDSSLGEEADFGHVHPAQAGAAIERLLA